MKRLNLIQLLLFVSMIACSRDSYRQKEPVPVEENLSITSPGGYRFANSIDQLRTTVKADAVRAFGHKSFSITKIEFTETARLVASLVEFRSIDGQMGTVLLIGDITSSQPGSRQLRTATKVDCNGRTDATGATCRERIMVSTDNTLAYDCTCPGSSITITRN